MRTTALLFVVLFAIIFMHTGYGKPLSEQQVPKDVVEKIQNDVTEIRRDQLNYKIEKDLLKETYSSNLQTINIVITIVLGVFSIIGFFGIRSIGGLKKEYSDELKELIKLREQLVSQMGDILREQADAKKKYNEVASVNEKQEKRLEVLEIQEKAGSLLNARNYIRALDYLSVGLSTNPDDLLLLKMKLRALAGINQPLQAIEVGERILELEPNDISTIQNLSEAYLLSERINDYDSLKAKYESILRKAGDGSYIAFFDALRGVITEDITAVKKSIAEYINRAPSGMSVRLPDWDYSEVKTYLKNKQQSQGMALFMEFLKLLQGEIEPKVIKLD